VRIDLKSDTNFEFSKISDASQRQGQLLQK
jgi:hypothetical protein